MADIVGMKGWFNEWNGWGVVLVAFLCAPFVCAEQTTVPLESQLAAGAELYGQSCAICHYDGAGNPAAPDLKGSSYLKGGPEKLIVITLKGQGNVSVVNGKKFNGQMPKMDYLTDEEVAAITAYVLASFGGEKQVVRSETVKSLRGQ